MAILKKNILFVDEDANMLKALQRSFRKYRDELGVKFVEGAVEAFEIISSEPIDILGLWGLPEVIIEAVAFHHNPQVSQNSAISPLAIIHAVNAIENAGDRIIDSETLIDDLDLGYLEALGLSDRIHVWRKICEEHL